MTPFNTEDNLMRSLRPSLPELTLSESSDLPDFEPLILKKFQEIESWFNCAWQETPAPLTSSVDLRHAGFKLAPVDTNLFPAGFNNLNPESYEGCIQALRAAFEDSSIQKILLIPENHTRNLFYWESFNVLCELLQGAGFQVRLGSFENDLSFPLNITLSSGKIVEIEALKREGDRVSLVDFLPDALVLNNDLSAGCPDFLKGLQQSIYPPAEMGWHARLKSTHFSYFDKVVNDFSLAFELDPWRINPYFSSLEAIDFMAKEGLEALEDSVASILEKIKLQYQRYQIQEKPFVVVKSDNGTYGMSVMTINDPLEIKNLNRKQRTRMSTRKGQQKVDRVLIQEGVYTFESTKEGAVAEPVVYMLGSSVVGGFYRVHKDRGKDENLNSPGMHFEPLAFSKACHLPSQEGKVLACPNRFYVYTVIARLAALAAAKEIAALKNVPMPAQKGS